MISGSYYMRAPEAFEGITFDVTEEDFNYLCAWVTNRVPEAEVFNHPGYPGSGAPGAEDPFVWNEGRTNEITHPDGRSIILDGRQVIFIDGWFEGGAFSGKVVDYPAEWGPSRHVQGATS